VDLGVEELDLGVVGQDGERPALETDRAYPAGIGFEPK